MKIGGQRNYSYGRTVGYAIRNILLDRYGRGNYGTRYTNRNRLTHFENYLGLQGIRDLREVSTATVSGYAAYLKDAVADDQLALSTAVNRLSCVNVLMQAARGEDRCTVSPAETIGRRSRVRVSPPLGLDASTVWSAAERASEDGDTDLAIAITVCRFAGARIREAALLDVRRAARSAAADGVVRLTKGSKGNRAKMIPREIAVPVRLVEWLGKVGPNWPRENLVAIDQTFHNWYLHAYGRYGPIARSFGLHTGFHDLRSAYANDRYREITGVEAPCLAGKRLASSDVDVWARRILAEELGHSRIDVVAAYVGGRR